MKLKTLTSTPTDALVSQYNTLKAKARKTPKAIRRNTMPKVGPTLQLFLDELHRRADQGDNQLHQLDH